MQTSERGSHFTRGCNRGDLTGKMLVSWKGDRLWEVVAHGGSTVILTVKLNSNLHSCMRNEK